MSSKLYADIVSLMKRVARLENPTTGNVAASAVQSATGGTLTLTKALTYCECTTGGSTVALPTALSSNAGYRVAARNVAGSTMTFNGVSLAATGYVEFVSTGTSWRQIG